MTQTSPNHALQRTAAGPSRLQSARFVAAVAELGSLDAKIGSAWDLQMKAVVKGVGMR
jgi:hypothetical protein